jgi:glycosyltransferase involved in cell wall biosynthesis
MKANALIPFDIQSKYILFFGRLDGVKNISLLLKSFKILIDNGHKLNLLILGNGGEKELLKSLCKLLDIFDVVDFKESVSNPFPIVKNAELVVLPSLSESFGNVIVEAMSLGVTAVCTPTQGVLDVSNNGEYAYIANNFYDEIGFANLLAFALKNKLDSKKLRLRSKDFNMENSLSGYLKLIE